MGINNHGLKKLNMLMEVLKCLFNNATISDPVQDQSAEEIHLQRIVRQEDIISFKVFTNTTEDGLSFWSGEDWATTSTASTLLTLDLPTT